MKKRILNALYLSVLSAILAAAVLAVKENTTQTIVQTDKDKSLLQKENLSDIIVWNDTTRNLHFFDDELSDRECFSHYLMENSQGYDNIMAEILVGKESGEFKWTYGPDRDFVAESYRQQKAAPYTQRKDSPADRWFFLKLKVDDIPDSDIWDGIQEHWGTSLKDEHRLDASVNDSGNIIKMCEYNDSYPVNTWSAYINGDYFYTIECVEYPLSTYEELRKPMLYFYSDSMLHHSIDYCGHIMDDEQFYWRDHNSRDISLENPHRIFHQVSGIDNGCFDQPFGVTESAEYTVQLSENMPQIKICFTLEEDIQDLFVFRSHATMCPYTLKITDAKTDTAISETSITMSADTIDTVLFTDLDKDGYLDMSVVCPEHDIIDDYVYFENSTILEDAYANTLTDTWFHFYIDEEYYDEYDPGIYYYNPITRYIWNPEKMSFEEKTLAEINGYKQEIIRSNTVVVQPGDTLCRLAEQYLGDKKYYLYLYDRNRDVIGNDPDRIQPGMELEIE